MGKFNHSIAGSSTTNSCRCEEIEKKLNEAKKKMKLLDPRVRGIFIAPSLIALREVWWTSHPCLDF